MRILPIHSSLCCFLLLCATACILQPAMAANGTITIAYRGSGGTYIGDTIIFDGKNTFGGTTLLTISGPGLPSGGVPLTNLNDASAPATSVPVDQNGAWKYVWYASYVPGLDRMQTAKYTFTATDSANPKESAKTSLLLKKPAFSVTVSPDPSNPGDYLELNGVAENGATSVRIDVTDASGRILHTFTTPVGFSGSFSYNFRCDMDPGQYTVSISSPSLSATYRTVISVVSPGGTVPVTVVTTPKSAITSAEATTAAASAPAGTTPAKSPVPVFTVLAALAAGTAVAGLSRRP